MVLVNKLILGEWQGFATEVSMGQNTTLTELPGLNERWQR